MKTKNSGPVIKKVLITNAFQRKSLSVARSISKDKYYIYCCEESFLNPVAFSKYNKKFFRCPNPDEFPEKYFRFLVEKGEKFQKCLLYPMDDNVVDICLKHRKDIEDYYLFALPPYDAFKIAANKSSSVSHAIDQGILVPRTFQSNSWEEIALNCPLKFPVVIKPEISSGSRGIRLAKTMDDLKKLFIQAQKKYDRIILQEYIIPLEKIDVCLLYNKKSELRAHFVQKELRCYPHETGPSILQESISNSKALENAKKLLDSLKWVGIAEVEFLVDKNGELFFMEINPRFWASLELAVQCGVDFPGLYAQISTTGDCNIIDNYTYGIRTRWSFPGGLINFLTAKNKLQEISNFFFERKNKTVDDTFRICDPFPMVGVIGTAFYFFFNKKRRKYFFDKY